MIGCKRFICQAKTLLVNIMGIDFQVNTERSKSMSRGMNHVEGGWPRDVNPTETEQVQRYRKKIEKEDMFIHTVTQLGSVSHFHHSPLRILESAFLVKDGFCCTSSVQNKYRIPLA